MPDIFVFVGVLLSVTALVIFIGTFVTRTLRVMLLVHRVKKHLKETNTDQSPSVFRYSENMDATTLDGVWYTHLRNWIQAIYDQSGVKWPLKRLAASVVLINVLVLILAVCTARYWLLLLMPIVCIFPVVILKYYRRRKNSKMASQLPTAFAAISRMVKSGQTVQAAMRVIAEDFPEPVRGEFLQCYEQQNLGVTKEHALRRLASRTGIIELRMFAVAIIVQARFGGDISELLQSLADINRNRLTLKQRMRALTAEGRMQAIVLAILPLAAFGAIMCSNAEYITPLLDHPNVIITTVALQAIGMLWILKIIKTDY